MKLTTDTRSLIKKRLLASVAVVLLAIGSYTLSERFANRSRASAQTVITPFALRMEAYNFESNPKGELLAWTIRARRSDGAIAMIASVGRSPQGQTGRRLTLMDGREILIVDAIRAKTTFPRMSPEITAQHRESILNPPANCVTDGETLAGFDSILGQRVAVIGHGPDMPHASALDKEQPYTQWLAPDLGCEMLRYRILMAQRDGSFKLRAEGRAVSLKLGEPDASLFDMEASYEELRPSELLRRQAAKRGIPADAFRQEGERLDEKYLGSAGRPAAAGR